MTVRDAKDLDDAEPPHASNKMSVIKDGQEVTEVIIQEGVPTYERVNDAVAEPVVYMIDRYVVGGFYRVHAERGIDENLNAPGASFVPLAFAESTQLPRAGRQARRQRAEPLLHVRRDRPPGDAGRQLRAGSHRSGRRDLRLTAPLRRSARSAWRRTAHNSGLSTSWRRPSAPSAVRTATTNTQEPGGRTGRADAGCPRRRLRRHRHQPAVRAEGGLPRRPCRRPRPTTSWACCRWCSGR